MRAWCGEKGGPKGKERREREGEKNMQESKERDTLIEGIIMGLARSLALGTFPGIHKNDPS